MSLFDKPASFFSLRDFQCAALDAVQEKFKEFVRLLLVAPTGSGKTLMFAALAQRFLPLRTLILCHREELIEQAVEKIYSMTGIEAEVEKAERRASLEANIVVGSVQTMIGAARLNRWPQNHFGLVVADEAHHALSDSWQKVLGYFDAKVLGVTATPDRGDRKNLGKYFEALAYEIGLLDLIRKGWLSRIKIRTIPIKIDLRNVRVVAGDYDSNSLDETLAAYLHEIARALKEYASFRKILVFLPLIKTSKAFAEICRGLGLAARHIDGTSDDRGMILSDFHNNKFDVLCNAMLLTEGYDCPDVDCVICLRPTKVRSLYSQMIGRGTRIAPGKTELLLLDFLWMHEKHDLVKPASLIAQTERVADTMQTIAEFGEIDLEELEAKAIGQIEEEIERESQATKQRHDSLKSAIKDNSNKRSNYIDASEFFVSLHAVEDVEFEADFEWEQKEVSARQLVTLSKFGFNPASIKNRGHASRILDRIFLRRNEKLATPKQVVWLRKHKHPHAETATFEEAKKFLDEKFRKPAFEAK